jgi:hypothetical protein
VDGQISNFQCGSFLMSLLWDLIYCVLDIGLVESSRSPNEEDVRM